MSKKNTNQQDSQFSIKQALEALRSQMIDLEASAHAAEDLLQYLPYMPHPAQGSGAVDDAAAEARINVGRLQSMVVATAEGARELLQEIESIIERLYRPTSSNNGSSKAGETWHPRLARPVEVVLASVPTEPQPVRKSA